MQERNRVHCAVPPADLCGADDFVRCPVAAFYEHFGPGEPDQRDWSVVIKPGDEAYCLQRGEHRHAVVQRIDRPVRPFAETPYRRVAVYRDREARPERP